MRKWALRIGTLLLCLLVGYGSSFVWNAHRAISLCDINANPEKYAGTVHLRVVLYNDVLVNDVGERTRHVGANSACNGSSFWSRASVDLDVKQISLLRENQLLRGEYPSQGEKYYVSEAILVGSFEPSPGITGCFGPKYYISDARIERVIANHAFESREQFLEWLKSQSR